MARLSSLTLSCFLVLGAVTASGQALALAGDTSSPGWREAPPISIVSGARYSPIDLAYQLRPARTPSFRVVIEPGAENVDILYRSAGNRLDALTGSLQSAGLAGRFEGSTLTISKAGSGVDSVQGRANALPPLQVAPSTQTPSSSNLTALPSSALAPLASATPQTGAGGGTVFPRAQPLPPLQPLSQAVVSPLLGNPAPSPAPAPVTQQFVPSTPPGFATQSPQPSPQASWDIQLSDITIANTFQRWSKQSGFKVKWDASKNILVGAPDTVTGSFEQAVAKVLASPGIRNGDFPLEVCFYPNTPPLARITRRGEQEKECQ